MATTSTLHHQDERVRLCSEALRGIRLLKMQAWEAPAMARIALARSLEIKFLGKRKYLDAACVYLWASTPVLVTVATFASVVWFDPNAGADTHTFLSASSVFTAVSLLSACIQGRTFCKAFVRWS